MTPLPVKLVPLSALQPNPWNPNQMSPFIYEKEIESIREHGFLDPILVRPMGKGYQIIDGEHRWRAAGDCGLAEVPVWIIDVDDSTARRLTITTNELRGQSDPDKLAALLNELSTMTPVEELMAKLPFPPAAFSAMTGLTGSLAQLPESVPPSLAPSVASDGERRRWVERTYRLPSEVAEIIDQAIRVAKDQYGGDQREIQDWQALEFMAAELLATYTERERS